MRIRRAILALGAFFAVAVSVSACGSGVPGNSVADVAGNPITMAAYNHWMYVAAKGSASQSPGQPVIVPDPPKYTGCIAQARKDIPSLAKTPAATLRTECGVLFTQLSGQVLDYLIRSYWYQAVAAAAKVKVTDAQVQQTFNADKKQSFPTAAEYQTFLTQSGQTTQDILYRVRVNLIYAALLKMHTKTVSAADVAAYYAAHKSQYGSAESRDIRIVLAKTAQEAAAAKKALDSGQSWNAVAKKYSIDPSTKNAGGLLAGVTQGQQDAALDAVAFTAPANKVLGPVKAQLANGYYVFDVVKIKPATQQALAQVTTSIQQTLGQQQQTNAENAIDSAAKKAYLSQTTCRATYAMADCKGYKAPSTTSSTAPSTTTPTTTTG
jgi:parvulin-like peptidyl-prolyl isomerase